MICLSLKELELKGKTRGIKGYKSKFIDRLLSMFKETIKDKRNEDYDADKMLRKRLTIPDPK